MTQQDIILSEVLNYYNVSLDELKSKSRKVEVVARRFVFTNLSHRLIGSSEDKINEIFGQSGKGNFYRMINQFDKITQERKEKGEYATQDVQKMLDYCTLYEKLLERLELKKTLIPDRISPVSRRAKFRETKNTPKEEVFEINRSTGATITEYFLWFDCPSCGHEEVREDSKYCEECGSRLKW
jgi:predicted RNA-binding Zn-ribbon protein involved in translation (DUF1610 family)